MRQGIRDTIKPTDVPTPLVKLSSSLSNKLLLYCKFTELEIGLAAH